jgi:hypothetical protein
LRRFFTVDILNTGMELLMCDGRQQVLSTPPAANLFLYFTPLINR